MLSRRLRFPKIWILYSIIVVLFLLLPLLRYSRNSGSVNCIHETSVIGITSVEIPTFQGENHLTCDDMTDSYRKCIRRTTALVPFKGITVGIETVIFLRKRLTTQNKTLFNATMYWNENDRVTLINNLTESSGKCNIIYCGASDFGTDGLTQARQYPTCQIWFLEPVLQFYNNLIHSSGIIELLQQNKYHFYHIGLSNKNGLIHVKNSDLKEKQALTLLDKKKTEQSTTSSAELVHKFVLRDVAEIVFEFDILSRAMNNTIAGELNLLHLNCEGCEYNVIERLILTGLIRLIRVVQFASHRVPSLRRTINKKYCCLQQWLSKTHRLEFGVPWAWERWIRHDLA